MLIKKPVDIRPSEITSKENYLNRRAFIRAGTIAGAATLAGPALGAIVPAERVQHVAEEVLEGRESGLGGGQGVEFRRIRASHLFDGLQGRFVLTASRGGAVIWTDE